MSTIKQGLAEFHQNHGAMERRIRDFITNEACLFYAETGVHIANVSIDLTRLFRSAAPGFKDDDYAAELPHIAVRVATRSVVGNDA